MAESSYPCSVEQGFNFQKDAQQTVGHITSLKIGDTSFDKDIQVTVPSKINEDSNTTKVVGVASNLYWQGGFADPIHFDCQISVTNKQAAALLRHTKLSNTNVEFSFIIYEYDPVKKVFYEAFHTNETDMKGLIEKNGSVLTFALDETPPTSGVVSPLNFFFSLGVMPQEEEQDLHFAVSQDGKFVKKWGVAVAA